MAENTHWAENRYDQARYDRLRLQVPGLVRLAIGAHQSPVLRANVLQGNLISFNCIGEAGNLRIKPNGKVDHQGANGKWTKFLAEFAADGRVLLRNVGHSEGGRAVYLSGTAVPDSDSLELCAGLETSLFSVVAATESECRECGFRPGGLAQPSAPPPKFELTPELKQRFVDEGYLHLPGLVQTELVNAALQVINNQLGSGSAAWEPDDDGKEKLGGGVQQSAEVMSLLHASPTIGVVKQLLGDSVVGARQGQVALRFPMPPSQRGRERGEEQWHIDGMQKSEHMTPFDLLVGVALSAQPSDDCGNLALWPGTHAKVHEAVARQRAEVASTGADWRAAWARHRPPLKDDRVQQMQMQPGDVVIAHQKLPHRISLNHSPNVRYQIYFRISSSQLTDAARAAPLGGLWDRFEGLRGMTAYCRPLGE